MMRNESKGGFPTSTTPPPKHNPPPTRVAFIGKDLLLALDGRRKTPAPSFCATPPVRSYGCE